MRLLYFISYVWFFFRELVKSNIEVAKLALSPSPKIRPAFLAVPMKSKTDFEITSLANSLTLTPGTIAVHVERNRELLVIHALDIGDDADLLRDRISNVSEVRLLKWAGGIGKRSIEPATDGGGESDAQGGPA